MLEYEIIFYNILLKSIIMINNKYSIEFSEKKNISLFGGIISYCMIIYLYSAFSSSSDQF
jgi:phosphotransferase system  glucose/maltose/N-acetylglucosamine-specific IIC component